ncbi:MAG: hypothetical protein AAF411_26120 [Myxococcota bacterium]
MLTAPLPSATGPSLVAASGETVSFDDELDGFRELLAKARESVELPNFP